MPERKRKKQFFDLFGFDEKDFLLDKKTSGRGSGYSISVTYDETANQWFRLRHTETLIRQNYAGILNKGIPEQELRGWKRNR